MQEEATRFAQVSGSLHPEAILRSDPKEDLVTGQRQYRQGLASWEPQTGSDVKMKLHRARKRVAVGGEWR